MYTYTPLTQTRMDSARTWAIVAILAGLMLTACEPLDDWLEASCNTSEGTAVLEGTWTISGQGTREGCRNPQLNGDFTLGPSTALSVAQGGADGAQLTLSSPVSSFALKGEVTGSCVELDTEEDWRGAVIMRSYSGMVTYSGDIEGTFTGNGPEGCNIWGEFTVQID